MGREADSYRERSKREAARRSRVRRAKRNRRIFRVLVFFLAAACVFAIGRIGKRQSGGARQTAAWTLDSILYGSTEVDHNNYKDFKTSLEIDEQFLTVNRYSRPGTELQKVDCVVVHYVGNPGTSAQANRNYFESLKDGKGTYASSHFVIGLDGEVIQCIPLSEVSYASKDANSHSISIECCHPDADGKFSGETYDALVRLTADLCKAYNLERDQILRHYDVTGKICPKYFVDHEDAWQVFLDDVERDRDE